MHSTRDPLYTFTIPRLSRTMTFSSIALSRKVDIIG
jgi:hypothetical protein